MTPVDLVVAIILLAGLLVNRTPAIPVAAMGVVALRGITARLTRHWEFRRIELAIVACVAYWLVNYSWSTHDLQNLVSFQFLRNDGAPLITYPVFLFLLGWSLRPSKCQAVWIAFISTLGLLAVPAIVLCLHLPHPLFFEDLNVVKPEQSFGHDMFVGWYEAHNTAGGVYALGSIMALALWQEEKFGYRARIYFWFLLLLCIGGLAFTYSRSGYVAFVVGAAFVLPLRKLSKLLKIGLLAVIPTSLFLVSSSSLVSRIDTITDPYYGTNASRLVIWQEALNDFALSPLVGIGFGRFNDEAVQFEGAKNLVWVGVKGIIKNNDGHAHNSYLHFLAEGGIVGLFFSLYLWWCAWAELSFFERKFPKSKLHWLHRGAKACMLGTFTMSLTEHYLGRGSVILILTSLVGTTLATARWELSAVKEAKTRDRRLEESRLSPVPVGRGSVAIKPRYRSW